MNHNSICAFLQALRDDKPFFTELIDLLYTQGYCANVYKMLKALHPEAVPYGYACWSNLANVSALREMREKVGFDHVITRIGDRFYDISGEFTLGIPLSSVTDEQCAENEYILVYDELTEKELDDFLDWDKPAARDAVRQLVANFD
jgi:hypothetical protein